MKIAGKPVNKGFFAVCSPYAVICVYAVLSLPVRENKGKYKGKARWVNGLLQCEFTNEMRVYRDDNQIICIHIAA